MIKVLCNRLIPADKDFCPKNYTIGNDQLNEEPQDRYWEQETPIKTSQRNEEKQNLRDSLGILVDQSSIKKVYYYDLNENKK